MTHHASQWSRALAAICIALALAGAAKSAAAATFNVRDHGAKADGAANDAPALQALLDRVCKQGGGTLYFPGPATYLVRADAAGMVPCGRGGRAVFKVTADHVRFLFDPGAQLHVVTDFIPKATSPDENAAPAYLFFFVGPNAEQPFVLDFRIQGGLFTWEAGQVPLTDADRFNHWRILGGAAVGSTWRDAAFDGFPQGGVNEGMTDPDGMRSEHSIYQNCQFLNWGGGSFDTLFQPRGSTTFDGCTFRTNRDDHGHAIEIGGDCPGVLVRDCLFDGIQGSRGLPLCLTGSTGGDVQDVEVRDSEFLDCDPSQIGDASKGVRLARFRNLRFRGGGLTCRQVTELRIADCLGGHLELDDCHQAEIRDCSSTLQIAGAEPSTEIVIHHCTLKPVARVADDLPALFALRSARNAIVEGCILDVSDKDRPAAILGGTGTGVSDVLFRGNSLAGAAGVAPLLLIESEAGVERATIAENAFRFDKRAGVAGAIVARGGRDVTIRDNRFDAPGAKVTQSIAIGNMSDKPAPGPWQITGNIDRSDAPAGGWKVNADEVALIGNSMPFPLVGQAARNEGNVVAAPRPANK